MQVTAGDSCFYLIMSDLVHFKTMHIYDVIFMQINAITLFGHLTSEINVLTTLDVTSLSMSKYRADSMLSSCTAISLLAG